jgi:pimeloyl-ACP methyl ester carboxylesterase
MWELVLPQLERRHDVLAPTLAGHAGGPAIDGEVDESALVDAVERTMDAAGFETAHLVGNSLGGFVALQLAERGRARTVVALAPAGGWARGDPELEHLLRFQSRLIGLIKSSAPQADSLLATEEARRRATSLITENYEHIPQELLVHWTLGAAAAPASSALLEHASRADWQLDAERITCPVRIVWGAEDKLLPWPSAAARFRTEWLPNADWVELDGVGHCPQLDVPLETAELILGFTSGR